MHWQIVLSVGMVFFTIVGIGVYQASKEFMQSIQQYPLEVEEMETMTPEQKAAEEKAAIEVSHPNRFDGHEHKFTSGLGPGNRNLRICTVAGCGYTEGL
jgi:hypothetical protein